MSKKSSILVLFILLAGLILLVYLGFRNLTPKTQSLNNSEVANSEKSTAVITTITRQINSPEAVTAAVINHNWVNISPAGVSTDPNNPANNYGFSTVVVDPATPTTLYTGTNYQGLYKSTNSGASWVKINTGPGGAFLNSGRLWTLAIDPFNSNILYTTAGYGEGGILKSVDGGVSWQQMLGANGLNATTVQQIGTNDVYGIALDPYKPNHLVASFHYFWHNNQDSGVVESVDGGNSWVIHNPPAGGGWGAGNSVWFVNNSQTWLVGSQGAGIWRTSDSGASWSKVYTQNTSHGGQNALYRDPVSGTVYMALWTQVIKSTTNGSSWSDLSSGLPSASWESIIGDGTNLYTMPAFPSQGKMTGQWYTIAQNGGTSWKTYSTQTLDMGPFMMGYDPVNYTIYSANGLAGVWKLQTKVKQSITVSGFSDKTYGDPAFTVSAGASSGLAVSLAATGQCSVAGNTVTITAAGTCSIRASQAGDTDYAAAPDVVSSFNISLRLNAITLPDGQLGQVYPTQTILADGGTAPYTYTISTGELPDSLTLSSSGQLAGTIRESGSFTITISAVDNTGKKGNKVYSILVPPVNLTLSSCDEPTLRSTITTASEGYTILFNSPCTIILSQTLSISRNITIDGNYQPVIISGGNSVGVFQVANQIRFKVFNLNIINGRATNGGGINNAGGVVTVNNVSFKGNSSIQHGNAIYNSLGRVKVLNTFFASNFPTGNGSINTSGGTVSFSNSVIN